MVQLDKIEATLLREIINEYISRREKKLHNKPLRPITRNIIRGDIDTATELKDKTFGL